MRSLAILLTLSLTGCVSCSDDEQKSSSTGGAASGGNGAATTGGAGGATAGGAGGMPVSSLCDSCEIVKAGTVQNAAINETSGLANSSTDPYTMFVHNDSGDAARFFIVNADGSDRGVVTVDNALAVDWEDMARGPCGEGVTLPGAPTQCLFFADFGDNNSVRDDYVIYRTPEPAVVDGSVLTQSVPSEALAFSYPDGSHDAEAIAVHPTTGDIIIITKRDVPSDVYRFPRPLDPSSKVTLEKIGTLSVPSLVPSVTAADFLPNGRGILVRTYGGLHLYEAQSGDILDMLAAEPCALPVLAEQQGEAVAALPSSDNIPGGYATISEGVSQDVHRASCP